MKTFLTDEDQMIYHLTVHRNMITWLMRQLQREGIEAQRTTGNDPRGDIILLNPEDVPRAQQIIRELREHDTR